MKFSVFIPIIIFFLIGSMDSVADVSFYVKGGDKKITYYSFDGEIILPTKEVDDFLNRNLLSQQPLESLRSWETVAKSYVKKYLDCGFKKANKYQAWLKQTTDEITTSSSFVGNVKLSPIRDRIFILSYQDGKGSIIIDSKNHIKSYGPCAAASRSYDISKSRDYVAILSEDIKAIDLIGVSRLNWGAKYQGTMSIHLYKVTEDVSHETTITTNDNILDMVVSDDGSFYILIAKNYTNWFNPMNWLLGISGHAEKKSDLSIRLYDKSGNLKANQSILKGSVISNAQFVGY